MLSVAGEAVKRRRKVRCYCYLYPAACNSNNSALRPFCCTSSDACPCALAVPSLSADGQQRTQNAQLALAERQRGASLPDELEKRREIAQRAEARAQGLRRWRKTVRGRALHQGSTSVS